MIELDPPRVRGDLSVEEALRNRRSIREYEALDLTLTEIGQLLWSAQGVTGHRGGRTAPSAGGTYPLELYVATSAGLFHYHAGDHVLEAVSETDLRGDLHRAGLSQDAILHAPAVFIVSAVPSRTEEVYGSRAGRYVTLEAGHAAQNLLLQAVALGLGAVPIGAFDDGAVSEIIGLGADERPLYLIPVGHGAEE